MGLLGEMTVRFGGDTSGLTSAVGMAKNVLNDLGNGNWSGAATAGLTAIVGGAIGFGVASVKAAGNFQESMSKVAAYCQLSQTQTDSLGKSILSLAASMGQSPQAMADALYPIMSSGYSASQALDILKLSAMTSAASGANMATVADMLTTSLKAMGAPASSAGQYMDMINKIVAEGKGTVQDYAGVVGKLSLSAKSANVPFADMGAALATLTTHGFPSVFQAANSLGNLFTQVGPKVDSVAAHAAKLKISFDEAAFKTMSLSEKMDYLQKITGGNQGELLKLVGGSTLALKAFNALHGAAGDYTTNLKGMQDATGTTSSVFQTTYGDWNNTINRLKSTFQVLMITVGQQLLPVLTKLVSNVAPIISQFTQWIVTSNIVPNAIQFIGTVLQVLMQIIGNTILIIENIINVIMTVVGWFNQWKVPIGIVAGLILAFFLPALIQAGISALTSGAQIAGGFISSMIETGTQAVINGAKTAYNFTANIIKAGIEGWQSVGKIGMFIGSMVTSGAKAVWAGAQIVGSFIWSMIQSAAKAVWAGAQVVGSFVASMATAAAKAVWAAAQVTASFIASMIKAGIQAAITAGQFMASLIPSIISFATTAITAAATAIPAILAGFAAWVVGAAAVAIANIAAFWPIYLIVLGIIAVIALVVLAVQHWGQISAFIVTAWKAVQSWFGDFWTWIKNIFAGALAWLQGLIQTVGTWLYAHFIQPFVNIWGYIQYFWAVIQDIFRMRLAEVQAILQTAGQIIYNIFIQPFVNAWNFISGIFNNIIGGIKNVMGMAGNIGKNVASFLHIPGFAQGVTNFGGGLAVVGENGPELVQLPQGSNVYPNGSLPPAMSSYASNASNQSQGNAQGGRQDIYVQFDTTTVAHVTAQRQANLVRLKTGRRAA